jgi:hypothetical protein
MVRGDGVPRHSGTVGTIVSATSRMGILSAGLLVQSAKRPEPTGRIESGPLALVQRLGAFDFSHRLFWIDRAQHSSLGFVSDFLQERGISLV